MLGHRELKIEEYVGILKRRALLVLGVTAALTAIGVGLGYVIPPEYESQTLILVQQQQVPEDYVKPVVDENLGARLASMKEQILSRSRLEPIINRYNLFDNGKNTMDDRVDLTRKSINVKQILSEHARGGIPGFYISFRAGDAHTAQQVCGEIASLFLSDNLKEREQSAEGTTNFLKQQLDDAKRTLDEQDQKLAAFQMKYLGKLPDQVQSNQNALQALTTQLDASTQNLGRLEQNETLIESLITQETQDLKNSGSPSAITVDERRKELDALIKQKQQLETTYTADYPDVVEISHKIADLEASIDTTPTALPATPRPTTQPRADTPQLQQLKAQLRAVKQSISVAQQEQTRIAQQVRNYESRIDASPMIEEEYKRITRDHETALQFYNSLLTKMNESSMATTLEQRQQGEQFSVLDPPNLPQEPVFPKRYVFTIGGLAAGLFLGLFISALLEYLDTSLRSEADIWAFTKLPTLARIPYVKDLPQRDISPDKKHNRPFPGAPKHAESTGH